MEALADNPVDGAGVAIEAVVASTTCPLNRKSRPCICALPQLWWVPHVCGHQTLGVPTRKELTHHVVPNPQWVHVRFGGTACQELGVTSTMPDGQCLISRFGEYQPPPVVAVETLIVASAVALFNEVDVGDKETTPSTRACFCKIARGFRALGTNVRRRWWRQS